MLISWRLDTACLTSFYFSCTLNLMDYKSLFLPIGHGQERPKIRAQENTGPSTCDVCMVSRMSYQTYINYAKNVVDPPAEPEPIQICVTQ